MFHQILFNIRLCPLLLVSIIGDKYQCSVPVTAQTDLPYYRRPPLILLCRAQNATKYNARTQFADNAELAVSKW